MVRHGGAHAPWTVLFLREGRMEPSCLYRTVTVLPVESVGEAVDRLKAWERYLQTVGAAGLGEEEKRILEALAHLGVSRITTLGGMPGPPPWWHHDGSGPLRDLARWTDLEADGWLDQPEGVRSGNA